MNKKLFIFMFVFMFMFSLTLVSAVPPFQTSNPEVGLTIEYPKYEFVKAGENFTVEIHVFNSTNGLPIDNSSVDCVFHGYYGNGSHAIKENMTFDPPYDFEIKIPKEAVTLGKRAYIIQCNNSEGGFVSSEIEITLSGMPYHLETLWASLFIILVLIGFSYLIYKDKKELDDEKYWNKMVAKWKDKNYLKFSAIALWYNMKKNSYVLQYLIGLLGMIVIYEIILNFNVVSIQPVFSVLLSLYTWGAAIVTLVLFGNVQEWLMQWKKDIEDINWGMSNVK